jgi:hypothetical protein
MEEHLIFVYHYIVATSPNIDCLQNAIFKRNSFGTTTKNAVFELLQMFSVYIILKSCSLFLQNV